MRIVAVVGNLGQVRFAAVVVEGVMESQWCVVGVGAVVVVVVDAGEAVEDGFDGVGMESHSEVMPEGSE